MHFRGYGGCSQNLARFHPDAFRDTYPLSRKMFATGIGEKAPVPDESDKNIVRLAVKLQRPIRPGQVCELAGICAQTALHRLKGLTGEREFPPAARTEELPASVHTSFVRKMIGCSGGCIMTNEQVFSVDVC